MADISLIVPSEVYEMIEAVVNKKQFSKHVPTFEDGYKNSVICHAILESAESGKKVFCKYE